MGARVSQIVSVYQVFDAYARLLRRLACVMLTEFLAG